MTRRTPAAQRLAEAEQTIRGAEVRARVEQYKSEVFEPLLEAQRARSAFIARAALELGTVAQQLADQAYDARTFETLPSADVLARAATLLAALASGAIDADAAVEAAQSKRLAPWKPAEHGGKPL